MKKYRLLDNCAKCGKEYEVNEGSQFSVNCYSCQSEIRKTPEFRREHQKERERKKLSTKSTSF